MERHLPACGGVVFDDQGYLSRFLAQAAEEEETIAEMTSCTCALAPQSCAAWSSPIAGLRAAALRAAGWTGST